MRVLILAVALGAALHAHAPPGSPQAASPQPASPQPASPQPASPEPAKPGTGFPPRQPSWKFFPDLKSLTAAPAAQPPRERISLKPGQACAIPLLNVLRPENVDPKMILPSGPAVGARIEARIRIVTPPAPSCDDVSR
ncbi:MAG TPA: hypothetical protein VNY05_16955 [Candidatus Acidoferrales bacterium]|jgi:hypothetical protein|nr:hypothetical protein [Candidatus Acidoferrales bacterium]